MQVFVTGGSGFLGGHLINTLVHRGDRVAALARSDSAAESVAALGAAPVRGSLASTEALRQGMDGASLVVHCAAIVKQWGSPADFWETNVEGTRNVIEACRSAGVARLVHVSTEAVLLEGGPLRRVNESEPYPDRFAGIYPETKARAEQLVLGAADDSLDTVAVRPRFLWGPGDLTLIATLADKIDSGAFRWINGGADRTSTCHAANCVAGILLAAERGSPGRAYFLTDGEPATYREFYTALLATRGIEIPDKSAPGWLVRAAASTMEQAWTTLRLGGAPPLTRAEIALGGQEITVDDTRARQELGYKPVVSRSAGMAELNG